MLRKPVPFYNQQYNLQLSQKSSGQSSSAEYSYKNKSSREQKQKQLILNQHQLREDYENNPTRRGTFNNNTNGDYLVNETKVKRPVVTMGNNSPYTLGSTSYKLEKLSPYGSDEMDRQRQNLNSNQRLNPSNDLINNNNRVSQDNIKITKPQHWISFGNITNRNLSTHSSKKSHPSHPPVQQIIDKQNYQPNSDDSYPSGMPISVYHPNKNNTTKTSTNPSLKDQLLAKKLQYNQFLLPIVNTNTGNHSRHSNHSEIHNFHSNNLSQASSITSQNQSRISQSDESAYLKQKLIETHSKLLKQLEISKELEDNFFELKKKYQQAISLINQYKPSKQPQQMNQSYQKQYQQRQPQWNAQKVMLNQKVLHMAQENRSLKEQLAQMSDNMSELILQNQTQKQKQQAFKYSSNDLKQCINEEKAQYSQQLSQYNYQKAQYQEELTKQAHKISQLKNDLENMRNRVLELIKEKESREQQIQSFTDERQFIQNQLKVLEEKYTKKQKEFGEKEELCEIWRKKYSDAQEQYQKVYESSIRNEKQSKQLKNHNIQLNIALRQQKQKNAQMLSQIINLQMQVKQLKSKVSSLEQQRKILKDKLFENSQQKNLLQQKLQLQHNIEKLTHQYNSLAAIINKKDKQINELSSELMEKNNILHKISMRERDLEIKEKELQKKERELQDQKISRITNVKEFVNKLEEDRERSVGARRASCNNGGGKFNGQSGRLINSMQQQGNYQYNNYQQQPIIRQNVLNQSSSMRLESGNTTPTRQLSPLSNNANNNKTVKNLGNNHQVTMQDNSSNQKATINQQRLLTPSKSLSGLKVNNIEMSKSQNGIKQNFNAYNNPHNNNKMLICENGEDEGENYYQQQEEYGQQYFGEEGEQNYNNNMNCHQNNAQYESVEDSLQLVRMINKISPPNHNSHNTHQIHTNNHANNNNNKTLATSKSAQQLLTNKQFPSQSIHSTQSKPSNQLSSKNLTQQKQKQKSLSSYKQQKQQYLSLLQEIGQLQTQNYNLNQEKKKIIDELDKIESTKTKTKEMIARRRQLQLWLLGNQKKNNQVKDKLKLYRGKVM